MPVGPTGPSTAVDFTTRVANVETINLGTPDYSVGAAGAIPIKQGVYIVQDASVVGQTLALPISGPSQTGGDDGKTLRIVSASAFAHVITTPANGFNGALHIATFAAAKGNGVVLVAFQGTWLVAENQGITLS